MPRLVKRLLCLAAAVLSPALLCGCEAREPAHGIAYRITGGKNPMVVLGSIHVGSPEMEPYGEHLLNAMAAADTFVFECNSDDPEVARLTQSLMMFQEGTLEAALSPETWQLLNEALAKVGMGADALRTHKPWAVTSMLSTHAAAQEMGARSSRHAASMGVEETVEKHARGKQLLYLETASQQLLLMDSFSPALQEALLKQGCEAVLNPGESSQLANWPHWWHTGNAAAFAEEYLSDNSLPPQLLAEYHTALVTNRNRDMANALAGMLEAEEPHEYFVIVGLMHLVLPGDSILSQLEQMGYTVEQLFCPLP